MSNQKRKARKNFHAQSPEQVQQSLTFKPFLQIESHETIVIQRHRAESISYHPTLQITKSKVKKLTSKHTEPSSINEQAQQTGNNNEEENISPTRLDCSGQGECQPVTEEDDSFHPDSMREFLKNSE